MLAQQWPAAPASPVKVLPQGVRVAASASRWSLSPPALPPSGVPGHQLAHGARPCPGLHGETRVPVQVSMALARPPEEGSAEALPGCPCTPPCPPTSPTHPTMPHHPTDPSVPPSSSVPHSSPCAPHVPQSPSSTVTHCTPLQPTLPPQRPPCPTRSLLTPSPQCLLSHLFQLLVQLQ